MDVADLVQRTFGRELAPTHRRKHRRRQPRHAFLRLFRDHDQTCERGQNGRRDPTTMPRLAGLLLALSTTPIFAEECLPGHGMSHGELQALDLEQANENRRGQALARSHPLRHVRFVRQNVFPRPSHWLARQANRFHVVTGERALASAFILRPGDPVDETTRAEAERVLRNKPYLHSAAVLVRQRCGGSVDLDVVTQDVWTLTPGLGVSRSGGDNKTSISLSDLNIAGSGKSLSVEYFDDRDRSGTALQFVDPNVAGSRWTARLNYADNDDGEQYGFAFSRPFFSLDTPWALGLSATRISRRQDLEWLGTDAFSLDAEMQTVDVFVARSSGRRSGWVRRLYAGLRHHDETFGFPADFPGPATTGNTFSYPYIAWQLVEDDFVTARNWERMGMTEDLRLGWSSYVEAGWSTDDFGARGDHLLWRGSLVYRRILADRHLLTVTAEGTGRYDRDHERSEEVHWQTVAEHLWRQAPRWRLLTRAGYTHTRHLSSHRQLTLGGDSGLRGYPSRYQPGDRRVWLSVEQRYDANAYPFGLFRLGYAAFIDIGRAWFEEAAPAWSPPRHGKHFGTLANVGIGLRLESTRTRRDRVFHIDLAKPLVDGPGTYRWELALSGRQRF